MNEKNVLVTGGAGFIGSNLVESLLQNPAIGRVRVLDNLSTGFYQNIEPFMQNPNFEFIEGDIRDFDTCLTSMKDIDVISHQAALGSVPRSIDDPLTTNDVNISGQLNILYAAHKSGIKRVVYAASSSTYGDSKILPKVEENIGSPLSPYAVTKYVNELYATVFGNLYQLEMIGLRYFNVFGPRQDPNGAYAAVIPLFNKSALLNESPFINGDGLQTRDFTFIDNVVQINSNALLTQNANAINQVYNVACGERITINELWEEIKKVSGATIHARHRDSRNGDVRDSLANISKAQSLLQYSPSVTVREGIMKTYEWYKNQQITS